MAVRIVGMYGKAHKDKTMYVEILPGDLVCCKCELKFLQKMCMKKSLIAS